MCSLFLCFGGFRRFCDLAKYHFLRHCLNLFHFSSQLRFGSFFESRSIPPMNQIPLAAFEFSAVPLLLQRLLPSVHAQRFRSTHFSSNGAFQPITATYFLTKLDQGFLSPACSISTHFKACSRAESTVLGCSSRVSERPRAIVYAHQLAVAKS